MRALAAVLLALVALAGCGNEDEAVRAVANLTELEELRADFEEHEGKTRVVLLLAPT